MRTYFHVARVPLGCVLLAAVAFAAAQERLTPGGVALLVNQKTPESLAVLRQAVADPDVNVRRVAGRVAGVGNRSDLAPVLLQQLEKEQDDRAAAEELRAVLVIRGPQALEQTRAAARRLGGMARLAFAEWLARTDPARFAAALHDLAEGLNPRLVGDLARIAGMAVRQHPAASQQVTSAWIDASTGPGWRDFLDALGPAALKDGVLLQSGLTARKPELREQTLWFAVTQASYGRKLPLTHMPGDGNAPADESDWARAGRELLARIVEGTKRSDISAELEHPPSGKVGDAQRVGALREILTLNERTALSRGIRGELRASVTDSASSGAHVTARTFESVAPGMLTSLFEALGCTVGTSDQLSGVARVLYRDDGRVGDAQVDTSALSKECAPAVAMLSALTLAEPTEVLRPGETQLLLLPMDASAVSCADAPEPPAPEPPIQLGTTGNVTIPRKVRDVPPVYPESVQQARVQGTVVIESRMSETGCVRRSRVMRSVAGLDLAALRAVAGWRFIPALLDGKPVPVIMTVSVKFALR